MTSRFHTILRELIHKKSKNISQATRRKSHCDRQVISTETCPRSTSVLDANLPTVPLSTKVEIGHVNQEIKHSLKSKLTVAVNRKPSISKDTGTIHLKSLLKSINGNAPLSKL
ncbi:unnamed protein product, partial [Psylliodes chrysocephalus]